MPMVVLTGKQLDSGLPVINLGWKNPVYCECMINNLEKYELGNDNVKVILGCPL